MPNGKGHLECCYCIHWRHLDKGYDAAYQEGFCSFHQSLTPLTLPDWTHRICTAFGADTSFEKYEQLIPVNERFKWFGIELEKGVLYGFHYNSPKTIEKLITFD